MEENSAKRNNEDEFNSERQLPRVQKKKSETEFNLPKIANNPSTVSIQ